MSHVDEKISAVLENAKRSTQEAEQWDKQLDEIIVEIKNEMVAHLSMEMEQRAFFDERFFIYMPKYFQEMNISHIKAKYPNENRPKLLFTNSTDTINIGINTIIDEEEKFIEEDVTEFRDIMMESFFATSPSSKMLDKGDFKKEDKPLVAYYCFDSYAIGGLMYNLIFVTLLDEAILIVSMNCAMKDIEKNKLLFYGIMHTAHEESKSVADTPLQPTNKNDTGGQL